MKPKKTWLSVTRTEFSQTLERLAKPHVVVVLRKRGCVLFVMVSGEDAEPNGIILTKKAFCSPLPQMMAHFRIQALFSPLGSGLMRCGVLGVVLGD